MTLNIENETEKEFEFDPSEVADAVINEVLDSENFPYEAEVSILITDDHGIHEINKEQRNIDRPTDVLSFPMIEYERPGDFDAIENADDCINPETGEALLGDIVISIDKVEEQARVYGHSEKREFAFLVAHSMFHLLGYDHVGSEEEAKVMEEKQEAVLNVLGITRNRLPASDIRNTFKDKKRIVIKIGSSSLEHHETGRLDIVKIERLVREISDLRNQGKEVVLVSSGATMVGRNALGFDHRPAKVTEKQACASVGQARLMMIYQKLFSEYNQICSQILLTKSNVLDSLHRVNARNTFNELLRLGVIPVVNDNDAVATYGINDLSVFGDNDTLSAIVSTIIDADLLIVLSDIDGLYTDNPRENPDAVFIEYVEKIDDDIMKMGKDTESSVGTGGMATKLSAAKLASAAGTDMVLANGHDFRIIHEIIEGESVGTVFVADPKDKAYVLDCIEHI
ncbi:MAG: glutamate 5-kinase [Candidatus Alectryocaccobium sp.]|nr:glutamate 5-kinase [Candidatus Alectryocaccobium sp.]